MIKIRAIENGTKKPICRKNAHTYPQKRDLKNLKNRAFP